eukprot:UN21098
MGVSTILNTHTHTKKTTVKSFSKSLLYMVPDRGPIFSFLALLCMVLE